MLLLYMATAEQCLARLRGLVVGGTRRDWQAAACELKLASVMIHAPQLTALSDHATFISEDAASRMGVYFEIERAFDVFVAYVRHTKGLTNDGTTKGGQ